MNKITTDQRPKDRLDLLRAQRTFYGRAKRLQTGFLFMALALPWISFFWGPDASRIRPSLAFIGVVLLLVEIGVATRLQRNWVKTAARIQEQFDTEVLRLPWHSLVTGAKVDPEVIRSVTRKPMTDKEREDLDNWYEVCVGSIPLELGRLVCQRTNINYDMRVRNTYSAGLLWIAVLLVVTLFGYGLYDGLNIPALLLNVLVPFTPLAAFVLREHRKQADTVESLTSLKGEVEKLWAKALANPSSPELTQDSRNLQDAIYRNRTTNPLVYDWVYQVVRKDNEDASRHAAETLVAEAKKSLIKSAGGQ
ncbi:MAG: hypothetical protein JWR60_3976 [Polaromonas sp.]|nr:hypothetical protein [Polaromonas sp.]